MFVSFGVSLTLSHPEHAGETIWDPDLDSLWITQEELESIAGQGWSSFYWIWIFSTLFSTYFL